MDFQDLPKAITATGKEMAKMLHCCVSFSFYENNNLGFCALPSTYSYCHMRDMKKAEVLQTKFLTARVFVLDCRDYGLEER